MQIKITLLLLYLACFLQVKADDGIKRGLYFRSFEVDKDKRTCLNLTPDKPLVFTKGFSMEFDIKLRREDQNFGYIFRIVANDTLNIDFLAHITSIEAKHFSVVVKNKTIIQYKNTDIGRTIGNIWIKVLLEFDPANNHISLSLNGIKKDATCPVEGLNRFKVYFGGNMHGFFSTTDITPMTVKDIRFFDEKKNLVRNWELAKHLLDCVYDECESDKATVQNPVWEIDHHAKWMKKEAMICPGKYYQIAFDRPGNRIFIARDKTLLIYNTVSGSTDTLKVSEGIPYHVQDNQMIYDSNRKVLVSYDFGKRELATFDFTGNRWTNEDNTVIEPKFAHHSRAYLAEDSLFVFFGGYGFHKYNAVLQEYSTKEAGWKSYSLPIYITPRYLGSMGYLGNQELLYFGGFGNESGHQEEFPRNYYDLYTINVGNNDVKKIWELSNPKEDFTNSNSLVIDKNTRRFYALAYPNKRYASVITLHEYNLDKPEYRTLGDSIPYFFNDVESYCDLFQSSDSSELYAIASYVRGNNSDINIYSMAFPPLSPEEITQHLPSRSNARIWLLLIILLIGLVVAFMVYRKRKNGRIVINSAGIEQIPGKDEEPIIYDSLLTEKKPSSINLLGNFQMINNEGNDITKNFTPTTTQLFLLLLMSTIRNRQGITSQKLKSILWFDKDDDSARNNRNVYINKLRSILKTFGEIKVVNHEGYWSIQSEKSVFCDYERALVLIKMLQAGDRFNKKLLTELVDITLKGTLLPYIQQLEWLESYQTDYVNKLIECLMEYSKHEDVKTDLMLLLKIADAVLLHDNIDEDAIKLKCYALFRLGRKNQALQVFNKFTADYENLLATKHNLIFDELVKSS